MKEKQKQKQKNSYPLDTYMNGYPLDICVMWPRASTLK